MPLTSGSPGDVLGKTVAALGNGPLNMASATVQNLFTLPNIGAGRVRVVAIVLENPIGTPTAGWSAQFGCGPAITDFSTLITFGAGFPQVIVPTNTVDPIYSGGSILKASVGATGAGTCTATIYGCIL